MNTRLNLTKLTLSASIALFASGATLFGQMPSPTASPSAAMQMQGMNQMPGMMSDSMTKMSEMCVAMMQQEKAAMPYLIGAGVLFGVLLTVALVLLIVLEIQWIKHWAKVLRQGAPTSRHE